MILLLGIITLTINYSNQAHAHSIKYNGSVKRYQLPTGPNWMYLYINHHKTKLALKPKENEIAKLNAEDMVNFGGKVPLVGFVKTESATANGVDVRQATLDDESDFDMMYWPRYITEANENEIRTSFFQLKHISSRAIARLGFRDLPQYLAAATNNDTAKLPNQSKTLVDTLKSDMDSISEPYKVLTLYYDKDSAESEGNNEFATSLAVGDNKTELSIQIFAKVKTQPTQDQDPSNDNDKAHLSIREFIMNYQLNQDDQWKMIDIMPGDSSDTALDTSSGHWIVQQIQN